MESIFHIVHIVIFPCLGMGHLTPFLRLASMAASHNNFLVTLIDTQPSPCPEEATRISSFFSHHPKINRLEFKLNCSESAPNGAFINQLEAITSSINLLPPLLSSLPDQPISAILYDFAVAAAFTTQLTSDLLCSTIPNYIVSTTSALCYSLVARLPLLLCEEEDSGFAPLPRSLIPQSWLDVSVSNHLLWKYFIPNVQSLSRVKGVLLNSFNQFEPETLMAAINLLPPVIIPVGPLEPHNLEKGIVIDLLLPWLDHQPAESVVFVSFGSRINMGDDQIRELGHGLVNCGHPFLWVLGGKKRVLQELLGDSLFEAVEKMKKNGMVIMKGWVDHVGILAHTAIGGFLNQCDWDTVIDASRFGIPVLGWPQHGDHKINGEVVESTGLGKCMKEWGWGGERLVKGEEIAESVREFMRDKKLRIKARRVGEEARKASSKPWWMLFEETQEKNM